MVELDASQVDDWTQLGVAYGVLRQDERALAALERAQQLDPAYVNLLLALSKFHGERGDYARALAFGEHLIQKHAANALAWNAKGYSLLRLGQFTPAIESLATAVRLDPDSVPAWINLGEAHLRLGEMGKAIVALERALKMAPKARQPRLFMAQAFGSSGQYALAKTFVDGVLEDRPTWPAAWVTWGMLAVVMNDKAGTLLAYEKLKGLNPTFAARLRKYAEERIDASALKFTD